MFWFKKSPQTPIETMPTTTVDGVEYLLMNCPTCEQEHRAAQVVRISPEEYATYSTLSERATRKARNHVLRWIWMAIIFIDAGVFNFLLYRHGIETGVTGLHFFMAINLAAMANVLETIFVLVPLHRKFDATRTSLREKYKQRFLPEVIKEKLTGVYLPEQPPAIA